LINIVLNMLFVGNFYYPCIRYFDQRIAIYYLVIFDIYFFKVKVKESN